MAVRSGMKAPATASPGPESPAPPDGRLSSWKEIAAYLGRDVRTVQRWEQTQGLPVYRHRHHRLSTAYAFKGELDAWWHTRPSEPVEQLPAANLPRREPPVEAPIADHTGTAPLEASQFRSGRGRGWVAAAALGALLVTVAAPATLRRWSETGAVSFSARDFVLVIPFQNHTGETLFDGTLEFALERELSASRFVNVVPRQRLRDTLELMKRPLDSALDLDMAREVALRDGQVRLVIAGRAERFGARYVLTADLVTPSDGALAASLRETVEDSVDALSAIQRLAAAVRSRLGEALRRAPASSPELPQAATTSLRALQLFARAWTAIGWNESEPVDRRAAVELLRQAIAIDPEFAQAQMTFAALQAVNPEEARVFLPHVERALAAAARSPAQERLMIEAQAHLYRASMDDSGDSRRLAVNRGIAALDAVLRVQPDHFVALARLIDATRFSAQRHRTRELAVRFAELRPTSSRAQIDAAAAALDDGDIGAARRHADRALALGVPLTHLQYTRGVWLALFDAHEAWMAGRPARALEVADRLAREMVRLPEDHRQSAALQLFFIYLTLGRLTQAEAVVAAADLAPQVRDQQLGRALALRGDRQALAAFLAARFRGVDDAWFVASNVMDAGLLPLAREVVEHHRRRATEAFDWYAGQLALAEGRVDEAIRHLTAAVTSFPPFNNAGLKIARQLSDAYYLAGRSDVALQLLEQATSRPSSATDGWEWLRARDRLAERYRELGRSQDAVRIDRELAGLLVTADQDHAIKRRLTAAGY